MKIEREALAKALSDLKSQGYSYLVKITAVDYGKYLEAVYILRNLKENKDEYLEVDMEPSDAWVPTVAGTFKGADWYEREMFEMFGIELRGRRAERLLLEKWNGKPAPMRKNFIWDAPYETSD